MPSRNVFRLQNSKIRDNRPEPHTEPNSHKQNLGKKYNANKIQYNFGIDKDEKVKHVKGLSLLNLPNAIDGCGSKDVIEELYKEGQVRTFSAKTSDLSSTTPDNIINKKIVNLVSQNIILESNNVYPDRISDCQVFYLETIFDESSEDEEEIDNVVTSSIKRYCQPAIQNYKTGRFLLDRVLIRKQIRSDSNTSCSSTNDGACSQDSLNDDFGPANFSSSANVCISYSDSRSTNCSSLSTRDSPCESYLSDNDGHCNGRISKEKQALIESFNVKSDEDIWTLKEYCDQYDLIYVPKRKCSCINISEDANCNKKFGGGLGYKLRCFKNKSKFPTIQEQPSSTTSCQLHPILYPDKKEKKKSVFSKLFSKVKKEPSKKECKCPDPGKDVKEIKNIKDDKKCKHIEDVEDSDNIKDIEDIKYVDDNKAVENVRDFSDVHQVEQRKEYIDKDVSISRRNLSSENKTQTCITDANDKHNCTEIPYIHEATATESKQLVNVGIRTSTPSLLHKKTTEDQLTNLSGSTEYKPQESQTPATLCYDNLESAFSCTSARPVHKENVISCTRGVQYRDPKVKRTKYPCQSNAKPKYKCPYCEDCKETNHFLDSTSNENKINNYIIREKKLKRRKRDHHVEDKYLVSDEVSTEPTDQTKMSSANLLPVLKPICKSKPKSPHKERYVCKRKIADQEECACLRNASDHDICKCKLKTSDTSKYKHNTHDKKLIPKETAYTAKIPVNNSTTSWNSEMCKPKTPFTKTHKFKKTDQELKESKDELKRHQAEKSKLKTSCPTICKSKSKHLMCNCADFSCQSTEEKKEYFSKEVSCIDSNSIKPKPSDKSSKTVTTSDKEINCWMVQKQNECISQGVDCTVPDVKKCSIEVSCSSLLNMFKSLVIDNNKSNKVDVGTSRTRPKKRKANKAVTCREVRSTMVSTDFDTEPTNIYSKITGVQSEISKNEEATSRCNELEKTEKVGCQLESIKEMISKDSSSEPTTKNCSVEVSCTNLLSQFVKECLEKALHEENDSSKSSKNNYMQASTAEQCCGESYPRGSCFRNPYTRDPCANDRCYRDPYPADPYPYPTNLYSSEFYSNEQCSKGPHLTQTPYIDLYYQTTNRKQHCKKPYMELLADKLYLQNPRLQRHVLDNSGAETNADVIESDDIARSDFTTTQPNKEDESSPASSAKCRDCTELCSGINAFFRVLGYIIGKGDYTQEEVVEAAKENKYNCHLGYDKWKTYNHQESESSSTVDDTNKMNCELLENLLSKMRDKDGSDYDQLENRIKNLNRALQNTTIHPYLSFLKNKKQQNLQFERKQELSRQQEEKRFNKMKIRQSDERQLYQPRQNKVCVCQIRRTEVANGLRRHNVINVCDISKLNNNRFRNCGPITRKPSEPEQNYYYNPFIPIPTIPTVKCSIPDHSKHQNYYYGETNTTCKCRKCNINACPYHKIRLETPMDRSVCSRESAPTSVSKNVRDAITKLKSASLKRYKNTLFQKIRGEIPPEKVIAPTNDVTSISTSDHGREKKSKRLNYNYAETKTKQKCSSRNKFFKNTCPYRKIETEIPTKLTNLPTRAITSISTFENMCPFSSCSFCKEREMCSTSTSDQSGNSN